MERADVLIIGSGIAGLSFAIKIAEARSDIKIVILTKSNRETSNTAQAQGGIAVVLDKLTDNFQQHIEDTILAGKGLSKPEVVEMVVTQAPERLQELIVWGASFDLNTKGEFELGLEGGYSRHRIVHHQDCTGLEMERKLLQKTTRLKNIQIYDYYFAIDLLTEKSGEKTNCTGVKALDTFKNQLIYIPARICLLATGGSGMIFRNTTNTSVATADGVAMAYRVGARLSNMNFIQFHPTALFAKNTHPMFLISEAVRGYGAHLVNSEGKRFVFRSDPRGELATRDIVSSAIITELKRSGEDCVYLDCRHLDRKSFRDHFPTIIAHCSSIGIHPENELIPVVPAAHYQCGGIDVDCDSKTTVENLYASGECANTGLHGANRLACNSLLEAVVFSHQAAKNVLTKIDVIPVTGEPKEIPLESATVGELGYKLKQYGNHLNGLMTYDLLYKSSRAQKESILEVLQPLNEALELEGEVSGSMLEYFELRNMLQAAILMLEHALAAKTIRVRKFGK